MLQKRNTKWPKDILIIFIEQRVINRSISLVSGADEFCSKKNARKLLTICQ